MIISSGPILDSTGAVHKEARPEPALGGTLRWTRRGGFERFKEQIALDATALAGEAVTFEDLDVKVEIPFSIYSQRSPSTPATEVDYQDMLNELLGGGGRRGRVIVRWTRAPSTLPLRTDTSAVTGVTPGSGVTQGKGRDPAASITDVGSLRIAERSIEDLWPVCSCARNSERGRRCYVDVAKHHWPITVSGMFKWKHAIVYDGASAKNPPPGFFNNTTARPRGQWVNTAVGQAMVARNSLGASEGADEGETSWSTSESMSQSMGSLQSMDHLSQMGSDVVGGGKDTMSTLPTGPRMTVYHYNQTFQPGNPDIVLALFKHDISHMTLLHRILAGNARTRPEDLGLTKGQLDLAEDWLVGWSQLSHTHAQDPLQMSNNIRHLMEATAIENQGAFTITTGPMPGADDPLEDGEAPSASTSA